MNSDILIAIIASLGLGGLIGTTLQAYFQKKNRLFEESLKIKADRYKALMILMWTKLNPKKELPHLRLYRSDIPDSGTLDRELKLELFNMMLYADDSVIKSLKMFIDNTSAANYKQCALSMRQDLYGGKSRISMKDIETDLS